MPRPGRQGRGRAAGPADPDPERKTSRKDPGGQTDRQVRRDARRIVLIEAALAVVRRDGPGASMDQMAAEAGVTKPILYRHFGDRAGLVAAIGEYAFDQVSAALDKALHADVTPRQMVLSTIDAYLQFIESDQQVYRFLVHRAGREDADAGNMVNEYISRAGRQVAMVLGEGLRAAGRDSGPAEPWAFGIVGMVHAAGDWWMDRAAMPRTRLAEYLTSLIYDGLPDADSLGPASTWLSEVGAAPAAGDTDSAPAAGATDSGPAAGDTDSAPAAGDTDSAPGVVTPLASKRRRTS
ncbi:MAG TPA: TetR/AcrR family transcriptional regulator [Acidimicrobiales bacterium]|nr:TetR/AcrR family transcriptional regulator [Acidimicrobiales bacterium]